MSALLITINKLFLRLSFGKDRRWLALSGFSSKNGRDFHLKYGRVQVQFTINRYCRYFSFTRQAYL